MTQIRQAPAHSRILATVAALSLAALVLPTPAPAWQLAACTPLIAVFGLPHGATDWQMARLTLRPRLGAGWPAAFAAFYGVAMALVGLAAFAWPVPAMLAFAAIAIWHFGAEDAASHMTNPGPAAICAFGLPPIIGPALFWPVQTAGILGSLGVAPGLPPAWLAAGAGAIMVAWLGAAALTLRAHQTQGGDRNRAAASAMILEFGALICLQAAMPPLPAFAAYFCLIHSPRHMASLPRLPAGWAVPAATAAAVAIIGAAVCVGAWWRHMGAGWAATNGLFWGLAALTAPHVLFGRLAAHLQKLPPKSGTATLLPPVSTHLRVRWRGQPRASARAMARASGRI